MNGRDGRSAHRMDLGRLLMVPVTTLLLSYDVVLLVGHSGSGMHGVLRGLGAVASIAFCALTIWVYLRRFPSIATSRSVTGHIAAVVATPLPLVMPPLHGPLPSAWVQTVADVLLLAGTSWSVWALKWLGRNFSIIPQARSIAENGPYRWIRHPLYAGEIVSALGVALTAGSAGAVIVWLVLCGLQVYRARSEEQVLLSALPDYRAYRARTAALIPGVF